MSGKKIRFPGTTEKVRRTGRRKTVEENMKRLTATGCKLGIIVLSAIAAAGVFDDDCRGAAAIAGAQQAATVPTGVLVELDAGRAQNAMVPSTASAPEIDPSLERSGESASDDAEILQEIEGADARQTSPR
jgi:hypothetical protein